MSEELLINVTPSESRVALVENGELSELFIERTARRGLVGNVYKGKVVRVLPGMQAAFIEIGLSRTGFLHASDMVWDRNLPAPDISVLAHPGQSVLVQVNKDMFGNKGARLSTDIAIPSRYLVFMPFATNIGISQRIESEEERLRLTTLITQIQARLQLHGGVIVRTAAEGCDEKSLADDIQYLSKLWQHVQSESLLKQAPALIYEELPLPLRIVRDLARDITQKIYIDSREIYAKLQEFAKEFVPASFDKIKHYPGERPLFDLYNIEDDIEQALKTRVNLKSGGYLIFDQTEAMTTIDVNTGSFVGSRSLEDTVFKTNLEATHVIARQLRLRNLGGIIIIDFIDMQEEEHRAEVLRALEKMLERDHVKSKITQVSELGLVEMTRKRTHESLEKVLCEACPTCQGKGYVKSVETVCYQILREVMRNARAFDAQGGYTVIAHPQVVERMQSVEAVAVADLEHYIKRVIKFKVEPNYTQEQFDVALS